MPPFFHLTSTFFGLTIDYKVPLLEEIYICTQHLKGFNYSDILAMPTYERRFFLSMLVRDREKHEEQVEQMSEENKNKGAKGSRQTKVSGNALKSKMSSGQIPLK